MFERDHHLRVAVALQALDADLLVANGCLFAGGTAIVLSHGEYRESVDIALMTSELEGYRAVRHLLTATGDLQAVTRAGSALRLARELRADQYGVRTMLAVGEVEIKFELIFEGRVALEAPGPRDRVCGVATLTSLDMATTKLLANSDGWADDGVFSRDLIDLAMLEAPKKLRARAMEKASGAYGESIERDLARAITRLRERRGRLDECMSALKVAKVPKAVLWDRIRRWMPG